MSTRRWSGPATAALTVLLAIAMQVASALPAMAIHHGTKSTTEDHPWMVAIEDPDGFQFCGGTVIRERFVLTAAHCVINRSPGSLRVVVGRTDLRTDEGKVVRVDDIWVHPKYQEVALRVDLALLTLRTPVTTGALRLARPKEHADEVGALRSVYGWGRTESHPTGSPVLRTTKLELAELEACEPFTDPDESPRERLCAPPPGRR